MFDLSDLNLTISIISSSINSDDRKKRKKVLEDLNELFSKYTSDNTELCSLFDAVRHVLWSCINDKAETVRDSAIDLLKELFQKLPCNNKYLEEILPTLLFRLEDQETCEPSEEIRLKLVELIKIIIEMYKSNVEAYIVDIIQTLAHTLVDKYSKVRQESAKCCVSLSSFGGFALYDNGYKLVKPLIFSFKHNHSRTRISAIKGLSAILKNGNWKKLEPQFVFGSLGERLFDDVPTVRMAIVELLGCWLLNLADRYSFFGRLVPLMLSCLADDQPEVSSRAWSIWSTVGRQYLTENEQELKEKMDFLDGKPLHYPPNVERPNLGCRTLVQRYQYQIIPPLINELSDWQPYVCVKSSFLLVLLVLHAEAELTQHSETLLLAMYKIAEDRGNSVPAQTRDNVEKAAEYLGYFLSASTWHKLVFPILELEPSPGNLFVLSALLRGTKKGDMEPYAEELAAILANTDICGSIRVQMQLETLKCCRSLLDNVTILTEAAKTRLLFCLYHVTSSVNYDSDRAPLAAAGKDCLALLSEKFDTTIDQLTRRNLTLLTTPLSQSVPAWTVAHSHFRLLTYLLSLSGPVWFSEVETIFHVLEEALQLDKGDVEVKSRIFISLATIFEQSDYRVTIGENEFDKFTANVVTKLIIPNLTWRAGLSAERLRTVVLACLVCITREQCNKPEPILLPCADLIPMLTGCVKDEPIPNRKLALECIDYVTKMAAMQGSFTSMIFIDMYTHVVDRLDDVDSGVRNAAIATLHSVFVRLPHDFSEHTHSAVFGHLVTAMLPYLDDDNEPFKTSVCNALLDLSSRAGRVLKEKLSTRMHLFKSQDLCQQLMERVNPFST